MWQVAFRRILPGSCMTVFHENRTKVSCHIWRCTAWVISATSFADRVPTTIIGARRDDESSQQTQAAISSRTRTIAIFSSVIHDSYSHAAQPPAAGKACVAKLLLRLSSGNEIRRRRLPGRHQADFAQVQQRVPDRRHTRQQDASPAGFQGNFSQPRLLVSVP